MLANPYMRPLANLADPLIAQGLQHGGATARGYRLGPPTDEVEALKVFLLCTMPLIASHWGPCLRPRFRLTWTTVFSHKTPLATATGLDPTYGHPRRIANINPLRCELADLLVVMDFPDPSTNQLYRQAGLMQGKDVTNGASVVTGLNHVQHHLLSCWPGFTLSKAGGFSPNTRYLSGLAGGAGIYGLLDRAAGTWLVKRPNKSGAPLATPYDTLGEWLGELATGSDGSPAERVAMPGRPRPADWPPLVHELMRITAGRRIAAGGHFYRRGRSDLIRMMDMSEVSPRMIRRRVSSVPHGLADHVRDGGTGDHEPSRPRDRGDGPISLLHIRFDPVEG
jgi:hypothetical protein